jgi:hypothetical protein
MIYISSQTLLASNLNILHTFVKFPAKLENMKILRTLSAASHDSIIVNNELKWFGRKWSNFEAISSNFSGGPEENH